MVLTVSQEKLVVKVIKESKVSKDQQEQKASMVVKGHQESKEKGESKEKRYKNKTFIISKSMI